MVSPTGDAVNKFLHVAAEVGRVVATVVVGIPLAIGASLIVTVAAVPINIVGQAYLALKKAANHIDKKVLSARVTANNQVETKLTGLNVASWTIRSTTADDFLQSYKDKDNDQKKVLVKELAQSYIIKQKIKKNNKINSGMKFTAQLLVPGLNVWIIGKKIFGHPVLRNERNYHEIKVLQKSLRKIIQDEIYLPGPEKDFAVQVRNGKIDGFSLILSHKVILRMSAYCPTLRTLATSGTAGNFRGSW